MNTSDLHLGKKKGAIVGVAFLTIPYEGDGYEDDFDIDDDKDDFDSDFEGDDEPYYQTFTP